MINSEDVLLKQLDDFLKSNGILHFSAMELTWVRSLKRRNIPPTELFPNILSTLHFLELLREKFGPIRVISGYRNEQNNQAVGGAKNSQHLHFRAVDSAPIKGYIENYKNVIRNYWYTQGVKKKMGRGGYYWGVHVDFNYKYRHWGTW